ncbi:MAG: hypothetical protein AAB074_16525 [Planctomycetota bacterium]
MWKTPSGDRRLQGLERRLFLTGAVALEELLRVAIQTDDDVAVGVAPFDGLALDRRRWLLLQVAVALGGDGPAPELNALSESAVMAVFFMVRINVGAEAGVESASSDVRARWRHLVRDAWMDRCSDQTRRYDRDEGYRQAESSYNYQEWSDKLEDLADLILWDRDFELDESVADRDPRRAADARHALGIDSGYFRSVPEPPGEGECKELEDMFELYRCEVEEAK